MGIENFTITLDNPSGVFYAGQVVSGRIQFVTTKPYESDGAFVKFVGMAEVHWTEKHTEKTGGHGNHGRHHSGNRNRHGASHSGTKTVTVHYRSHEKYLDNKICLYSPPGKQLQPYNYAFPFSLQLPLTLPSSFIGTVGKITYLVRANVHRSGMHMATKVTKPFSVVGIKDLNYLPHLQQPLSLEKQKTFGMLFWKSKPLTAQITINKQAFVSGENILLSGLIKNESDTKIKNCELKLIRIVKYQAQGKTRSDKKIVYKCDQPGIEKQSEAKWQNVPVFVPALPPSGLDGCSFIHTEYFLEVRIVPPGVAFALEQMFNITIGTIPFRQQYAPPPPAGAPAGAGYAAPPGGYHEPGPSGGYAPPPLPSGFQAGPPGPPGPPAPYPQAGPLPEKGPVPSAPYTDPSAPPSAAVPPPYGDIQPTYGAYLGDSNEPPAYDDLFKGGDDNEEHDDTSRNYQPQYPSFKIPPAY